MSRGNHNVGAGAGAGVGAGHVVCARAKRSRVKQGDESDPWFMFIDGDGAEEKLKVRHDGLLLEVAPNGVVSETGPYMSPCNLNHRSFLPMLEGELKIKKYHLTNESPQVLFELFLRSVSNDHNERLARDIVSAIFLTSPPTDIHNHIDALVNHRTNLLSLLNWVLLGEDTTATVQNPSRKFSEKQKKVLRQFLTMEIRYYRDNLLDDECDKRVITISCPIAELAQLCFSKDPDASALEGKACEEVQQLEQNLLDFFFKVFRLCPQDERERMLTIELEKRRYKFKEFDSYGTSEKKISSVSVMQIIAQRASIKDFERLTERLNFFHHPLLFSDAFNAALTSNPPLLLWFLDRAPEEKLKEQVAKNNKKFTSTLMLLFQDDKNDSIKAIKKKDQIDKLVKKALNLVTDPVCQILTFCSLYENSSWSKIFEKDWRAMISLLAKSIVEVDCKDFGPDWVNTLGKFMYPFTGISGGFSRLFSSKVNQERIDYLKEQVTKLCSDKMDALRAKLNYETTWYDGPLLTTLLNFERVKILPNKIIQGENRPAALWASTLVSSVQEALGAAGSPPCGPGP